MRRQSSVSCRNSGSTIAHVRYPGVPADEPRRVTRDHTGAICAGVGLFLGLPGPSNPLFSIAPATVGVVVLVLFLLLPRYVDWIVRRIRPGRPHTFLTETAASVRDTKRLVFHPNWRIVGAVGYLWFDIAVLFACFAAAGQTPLLAPMVLAYQIGCLSNFLPVPGGIGVLDGQHYRHARALRHGRERGHRSHSGLPRDIAVGAGHLGHDRVRRAPENNEKAIVLRNPPEELPAR